MRFASSSGFLSLASLIFQCIHAAKDAHYFSPGTSNPNVDEVMYWRDAVNVLQDLYQFQYLYVSFHSCTWSLFGTGQQILNCGGNGGEKSNWYMGHTACYRANAAYELYGVLKEEYGGTGEDDGCGKGTYINSFFTFMGVESFQQAIRLAGVDFEVDDFAGDDWLVDDGAFQRKMEENQNQDQEGDDRYQVPDDLYPVSSYCYQRTPDDDAFVGVEYNDDETQDHAHKVYTYSKFSSYGIGCQNNNYARKTYTGAFCDGNSVVEVKDDLSGFNDQIQSMQCIKIYDAEDYEEPDYDDEYLDKFRQNGNAEDGHSEDAPDNSYGIELYDSVDLLRFSRACNVLEYPLMCSDPYGLSAQYRNKLYAYTRLRYHKSGGVMSRVGNAWSWFLLSVGGFMLTCGYLVKKRLLCCHSKRSKKTLTDPNDPNFVASALERAESTVSSAASSISNASKRVMNKVRHYAEATEDVPVVKSSSPSTRGAGLAAGAAVAAATTAAVAGTPPRKKWTNRSPRASPIRGGVRISVQTSNDVEEIPRASSSAMYSYQKNGPELVDDIPADQQLAHQNQQLADEMLQSTTKTKYKRPGLAKVSRSLFGRSSRK